QVKEFPPRVGSAFTAIFTCHLNVVTAASRLKHRAALGIEICAPDTANSLRFAVPPNCGVVLQFLSDCRARPNLLYQRHSTRSGLPYLLAGCRTLVGNLAY